MMDTAASRAGQSRPLWNFHPPRPDQRIDSSKEEAREEIRELRRGRHGVCEGGPTGGGGSDLKFEECRRLSEQLREGRDMSLRSAELHPGDLGLGN